MRTIESKLLLYFYIVKEGCRDYIEKCEYTPYRCGYSEASEKPVNTYELCLFVTGIIKCPGEIEKHFMERHNKSTYRTILRAIGSLEKKGFIERKDGIESSYNSGSKWFRTYKLIKR